MTATPDLVASPHDPAASAARRGVLLVMGAAVCWSSGALITRLVSTTPWATTFWRSVFASLFLATVLSLRRRRSLVALWRAGGPPLVAAAVFMALASVCFIFSLAHTSVANTLLLMSTGPFVAGILGWIFLGERVTPRAWLTMGVAMAGVVTMVSSSSGRGTVVGDLLAIMTAASFATATVLVRRHPRIEMTPAAALATTLTALVTVPIVDVAAIGARDLALLVVFGIGQFGTGFLLFTAGARLIPVAESALIGMLEIVLGPLWVWLVLSERPAAASLGGGALILAALLSHTLLDVVGPRRTAVTDR